MYSQGYYILAALLVTAALIRKGDFVVCVLGLGLASSIVAPAFRGWPELLAWMAAIDAFVCLAMLGIWTRYQSMRAWSVGFIGLGKTALTLVMAGGKPHMGFFSYGIALNCAFLLQVIVAGGFADAVGHWLDGLLWRFFPRRRVLLRDGRG